MRTCNLFVYNAIRRLPPFESNPAYWFCFRVDPGHQPIGVLKVEDRALQTTAYRSHHLVQVNLSYVRKVGDYRTLKGIYENAPSSGRFSPVPVSFNLTKVLKSEAEMTIFLAFLYYSCIPLLRLPCCTER